MARLHLSDYALLVIAAGMVLAFVVAQDDVDRWFAAASTDALQDQTGSEGTGP